MSKGTVFGRLYYNLNWFSTTKPILLKYINPDTQQEQEEVFSYERDIKQYLKNKYPEYTIEIWDKRAPF